LTILRFFTSASLLAIAAGAVACTTASATTVYTPVTGIQIPSATVVAGFGCGTSADQVYRYAAVISTSVGDAAPSVLASSVFACFADGIFSNLPITTTDQTFTVAIYAYDQASFPPSLDCTSSPCPGDEAGTVDEWTGSASWTTTCTGMEVAGITTLATCQPLKPTASASTPSGGDAGGEAGGDDAGTGNDDANEEP
jgi:hypothetical protein